MFPGGTIQFSADFTNTSGEGPYDYEWTFSNGETSTEESPSVKFDVADLHTATLKVSTIAGSHEATRSVPVKTTGRVSFYTYSQPTTRLWRVRVNGKVHTLEYRLERGVAPICSNRFFLGMYRFDNIPKGSLTYEVDRGQGWKELTVNVDKLCVLVKL